jgi:hypothetical protein
MLIRNQKTAMLAVDVVGIFWILNLHSLLAGSLHTGSSHQNMLVSPWRFRLSGRAAWISDVIFSAWILYVAISLIREARGKERWLVVGLLLPVSLIMPAAHFSVSLTVTVFQTLACLSYSIALVAALLILRDMKLRGRA